MHKSKEKSQKLEIPPSLSNNPKRMTPTLYPLFNTLYIDVKIYSILKKKVERIYKYLYITRAPKVQSII